MKKRKRDLATVVLVVLAAVPLTSWAGGTSPSVVLVVPAVSQEHVLDGHLGEWDGEPLLVLRAKGEQSEDQRVSIWGRWDARGLHLALEWVDDTLDVEQISWKEAIGTDPTGERYDRLYLIDGLKFAVRRPRKGRAERSFTWWVSPCFETADGTSGPFSWHTMWETGERVKTPAPSTACSLDKGVPRVEAFVPWDALGEILSSEVSDKQELEARFIVTDSDLPGRHDEAKIAAMRARPRDYGYVDWFGRLVFEPAPTSEPEP